MIAGASSATGQRGRQLLTHMTTNATLCRFASSRMYAGGSVSVTSIVLIRRLGVVSSCWARNTARYFTH